MSQALARGRPPPAREGVAIQPNNDAYSSPGRQL